MTFTRDELLAHLLARLHEVERALGVEPGVLTAETRLGDELDSMGLIEYLTILARDCGVPIARIESAAQRRFGSVGELADAMFHAGLIPQPHAEVHPATVAPVPTAAESCWLDGITLQLPECVQESSELDRLLERPAGWLAGHAGIAQRHVWGGEDPLSVATAAGQQALRDTGCTAGDAGVLLVTSEAPPLLAGLGAALHHRFGLRATCPAVEVGGACTGFLQALWLARRLVRETSTVLIVAVEAPSRWLAVQPGPEGEAAALFGDGVAACVLSGERRSDRGLSLLDITLHADGAAADLVRVERRLDREVAIAMDGPKLAARAVTALASGLEELAARHGMTVGGLAGIVMHAGNGRLPVLLARHLGCDAGKIWSSTARTGNLGTASLPAAWLSVPAEQRGLIGWTAVGAGLVCGAALTRG